jgi:hypothetical protein
MMRISLRGTLLLLLVAVVASCSAVQATKGPESKDFSVLEKGTDRYKVLAEFEEPIITDTARDGRKYDLFKFYQGQHTAVKAGKAVTYGAAAVVTLGLSELVTTPVEGAMGSGAEIKLRVLYDSDDRVDEVEVLQDDRWLPVQDLGAMPRSNRPS